MQPLQQLQGTPQAPLRILLISLEFLSPFSGNGQYSRCITRGLKRAGAQVLVVSGRPAAQPLAAQDAEAQGHCAAPHGLVDVPLPSWGHLDRDCAWEAFGVGCCSAACVARIAAFAPAVACCVDYHAGLAWGALAAALPAPPPMVYLNFRLFCTSTGLHRAPSAADPGGVSDAAFYRAAERTSMAAAVCTVALCRQDALQLLALAAGMDPVTGEAAAGGAGEGSAARHQRLPSMATLLPPLRSDVAALVAQQQQQQQQVGAAPAVSQLPPLAPGHALLTSLVRLSPEKNAMAIPALLGALEAAAPGTLAASQLQPFFTGCGDASAYACAVKEAAAALCAPSSAAPAVLCTAFLGPGDLGQVLRGAALNIHPCLADAYGMTIVEAAAWGVPSLVNAVSASAGSGSGAAGGPAPSELFLPVGKWGGCCTQVTLVPLEQGGGQTSSSSSTSSEGLGARLLALARALPPVGACDLLAPTPMDGTAEQGVLCFDFGAPLAQQAAALRPLLAEAVAHARGGAAGGRVAAVAATARARALAWTEEAHGHALLQLLQLAAQGQ